MSLFNGGVIELERKTLILCDASFKPACLLCWLSGVGRQWIVHLAWYNRLWAGWKHFGRWPPLNPTVDEVCERFILPFDVSKTAILHCYLQLSMWFILLLLSYSLLSVRSRLNQSTPPVPVLHLSQLTPLLVFFFPLLWLSPASQIMGLTKFPFSPCWPRNAVIDHFWWDLRNAAHTVVLFKKTQTEKLRWPWLCCCKRGICFFYIYRWNSPLNIKLESEAAVLGRNRV